MQHFAAVVCGIYECPAFRTCADLFDGSSIKFPQLVYVFGRGVVEYTVVLNCTSRIESRETNVAQLL
jgi:hypothetical protein